MNKIILFTCMLFFTAANAVGANTQTVMGDSMSAKNELDWTGVYTADETIPRAHDGTFHERLEIKKMGARYEIIYETRSMIQIKYKAYGIPKDEALDVFFDSPISNNLNPEAYKKGNLLFTLRPKTPNNLETIQVLWHLEDDETEEGRLLTRQAK